MNWNPPKVAELLDRRSVPIPPELVVILREHIEEFGTAADGRLLRTASGGMMYDVTHTGRHPDAGSAPEQAASPLAARPYECIDGGEAAANRKIDEALAP